MWHTGITSRCYSDHLWRVRVQVSFIFIFIFVMSSLQNDPQWPWYSWYSHLCSPFPQCNRVTLWSTECSRIDGIAHHVEVTKGCSFHPRYSLWLSHHLLLGAMLSWAALSRDPPVASWQQPCWRRVYIFFVRIFPLIGYYKILSRVPCTIQ